MNRSLYYGYSQAYAPIPNQPYYRNEPEQPRDSGALPKNVMYITSVEPKMIEHLTMHKGQKVCIVTTAGKLEGMLEDVFIDHVTLESHGKKLHIRLGEIVYFEKAESKK
ncbi:DUF2642 domain-containing protein [Paenibacillus mesophilus]|uniref:DUF2642 domain-containing protein n=1 Tax=Paenibacillus mesophilus TaxID=2582849 RepID=UPI00110E814B|nr:DUF2642 domain-containing protein [Paenibacillus mesophilus]TMV47623.1 DUF2642 domain-containing protein [Paenibacillus mesophilus]